MVKQVFKRCALLIVSFLLFTSCATNPVTGRSELSFVSDSTANKMGSDAYPTIRQEWGGDFAGSELQEYVSSIGHELAKVSHAPNLPYQFTVTNSSQINAVCLPGGKIFITRGLLNEMDNEAQLAAVLGHEVGHATAKHAQKAMTRGILMQAAATVASIAIESKTDSGSERVVGFAALQAGLFGAQVANMKYGRDNEYQSDDLGVVYMMKAGYNPEGAIEVQEILASKEKKKPSYFESLMRSHPVSEERVRHVTNYAYENEAGYAALRKGDGIFADRFKKKTKSIKRVSDAFAHYDSADKHFKEGRTRDAIDENEKAISIAPKQAEFYIQKGDFALKAKKYVEAETAYNKARELQPGYYKPEERLGHLAKVRNKNDKAIEHHKRAMKLNANASSSYIESGYAYMEKKDYKNAVTMLNAGTKVEPGNGEAFTALGLSYEKMGQHQEAYSAYKAGSSRSLDKKSKEFAADRVQQYQKLMRK